jgi:site-specific recombinase XerC
MQPKVQGHAVFHACAELDQSSAENEWGEVIAAAKQFTTAFPIRFVVGAVRCLRFFYAQLRRWRITMQNGSLATVSRKTRPAVWQFRWSEKDQSGARVQRKRVIGTIERYPDEAAARTATVALLVELNSEKARMGPRSITVAQLCDHFEQRELAKENTWRSYSTKKAYQAYLNRWILPRWRKYELAEVRTVQVESWLRSLPLAKSSCAKIRNLMSVVFNHACRYELFERNPICLVRQSAKRRRAPTILMPAEIKALVDNLHIRERTLVLVAVSTGLRQSELFGLKWGDIDLAQGTMNVTRSIVYGVVGPCKTESSQKPVPVHPLMADALSQWQKQCAYTKPDDWVFASRRPRTQAVLGTGDFAPICSASCGTRWNPEVHRLAYVSSYLLDSTKKRGYRAQGDAGALTPFNAAINIGCLHAGNHSRQTRCASSRFVLDVPVRGEWNVTIAESDQLVSASTRNLASSHQGKRDTKKGTKTCPFGSSMVSL